MFTYTVFDVNGKVVNKFLTEVRIGRINNELYWDEFQTMTDRNSAGKILEIKDDYFTLEIVKNENNDGIGKKENMCA